MSLAILVPVLGRPANVKPLLQSIAASTPEPYRVLFLCDPYDRPEQDAIAAAGGWMRSPGGGYAAKIRAGVDVTDEPLLMLAADDLTFLPGWFDAAVAQLQAGASVVGLNDLLKRKRRPQHATHFLMTRDYANLPCADGSPGPLFQGYSHSCVDDELIATATHRGAYAYAVDAHVRHDHWMNGGAVDDETYRKGRLRIRRDLRLFRERSALWT